jgi:hypothetical protein
VLRIPKAVYGELPKRWIVPKRDFSGAGKLASIACHLEQVLPTATQGASFVRSCPLIAAILKLSRTMASESF